MPPGTLPRPARRALSLPLFDALRPPKPLRRFVPAHAAPRISFPGFFAPAVLPSPPSPDDPIDATRLGLRLEALSRALDDLPGQARRFARWRTCRDSMCDTRGIRRIWPLRPGLPPGLRRRGHVREIDDILTATHALAVWALERPDTS